MNDDMKKLIDDAILLANRVGGTISISINTNGDGIITTCVGDRTRTIGSYDVRKGNIVDHTEY